MITCDEIITSLNSVVGKHSIEDIESWIHENIEHSGVFVEKKSIEALDNWSILDGALTHATGKFFRVVGYAIETQHKSWDQPAIDQPEVGILGFLCAKFNGILHFLVQAKIEPGNINFVQLSPTVQATRSNFQKVHRGRDVAYLKYFNKVSNVIDRLQSEQGGRFYRKVNRNSINFTQRAPSEGPQFKWMTLGQLFHYLKRDNLVNMDTRTVLSHLLPMTTSEHIDHEVIDQLNYFRFDSHSTVGLIPLNCLSGWMSSDGVILHKSSKYFRVIGATIQVTGREVHKWDQPLLEPTGTGLCGLLMRRRENKVQILVQFKFEFGLNNRVQIAPTVQTSVGRMSLAIQNSLPFAEFFLEGSKKGRTLYSRLQSEEGGRFYREENLNKIIDVTKLPEFPVPSRYRWVDMEKINVLLGNAETLNIQLRSLLLILWCNENIK